MLVGAFKTDITPWDLARTRLAGFGFNRLAQGVRDPLYARVLYLSDGETEVALAALDLIGVCLPMTTRIRRKVGSIAPQNVHLCCTHTHSGPDTIGLWGPSIAGLFPLTSGQDPEYIAWLENEVVYAINKAKAEARPARFEIAADDSPKGEWSKNIRDPETCDERLTAIRAIDEQNKNIVTIIHFASHPEALWENNHLLSADFCGHVIGKVEEAFGGTGIYINGALGGMVTIAYDENMPDDRRSDWIRQAGQALGSIAANALQKKAKHFTSDKVLTAGKTATIPLSNKYLQFAQNMGIFEHKNLGDRLDTEVSIIEFGPVRLGLFPGEPLPAVGFEANRILNKEFPLLVSLGNDEIGYVLAEEMFTDELYSYEQSMSLGPQTANVLLAALKDLVG